MSFLSLSLSLSSAPFHPLVFEELSNSRGNCQKEKWDEADRM